MATSRKGGRRTSRRTKRAAILGAGGILWNESSGVVQLALVRRVKYKDWALPKGKLNKGETFEEASIREVHEETGCRPRLGSFVGMVDYPTKRGLKVVLYWNMLCRRRPVPPPNDEIAKVIWLTPDKALRRMSYAGDRRILRSALKRRGEGRR